MEDPAYTGIGLHQAAATEQIRQEAGRADVRDTESRQLYAAVL